MPIPPEIQALIERAEAAELRAKLCVHLWRPTRSRIHAGFFASWVCVHCGTRRHADDVPPHWEIDITDPTVQPWMLDPEPSRG